MCGCACCRDDDRDPDAFDYERYDEAVRREAEEWRARLEAARREREDGEDG